MAERFTPEDALQHEWILEATTPTPPARGDSSHRGGRRLQQGGGLSYRERTAGAEAGAHHEHTVSGHAAPTSARPHYYAAHQGHQGHQGHGHPSLLPRIGGNR